MNTFNVYKFSNTMVRICGATCSTNGVEPYRRSAECRASALQYVFRGYFLHSRRRSQHNVILLQP